ncbi:MAG: biotin-dependent carboxyltransferase family protein [Gaiellaceae bacterium]
MSGVLHVDSAGLQTTVQDYPGRPGKLAEGYFPAGAMDHVGLRAANLLVGNPLGDAALEVTLGAVNFKSTRDATICLTGAEASFHADGEDLEMWKAHRVSAGAEISIGVAEGPGFRQYLAVGGGIDVPELFGSRSTYTMGALGGLEGRQLEVDDELPLGEDNGVLGGRRLASSARPDYARDWEIEAVRGPQASSDFLTEHDMDTLFDRWWQVDRNSNRMGIRLESHKFEWARTTGGVAGGHPSNILDNPYAVGSVNINGDLPVILGPDGPTAGGFVVAATVAHAAMWKIGQLRPVGDRIRFREVSVDEAIELDNRLTEQLSEASVETA